MAFSKLFASVACALALASVSTAAPAGLASSSLLASGSSSATSSLATTSTGDLSTATSSAPPTYETDPPASDDPNYVAWTPGYTGTPEPMRGSLGSDVIGPQNIPLDLQNPDLLAPPTTDHGSVYAFFLFINSQQFSS